MFRSLLRARDVADRFWDESTLPRVIRAPIAALVFTFAFVVYLISLVVAFVLVVAAIVALVAGGQWVYGQFNDDSTARLAAQLNCSIAGTYVAQWINDPIERVTNSAQVAGLPGFINRSRVIHEEALAYSPPAFVADLHREATTFYSYLATDFSGDYIGTTDSEEEYLDLIGRHTGPVDRELNRLVKKCPELEDEILPIYQDTDEP